MTKRVKFCAYSYILLGILAIVTSTTILIIGLFTQFFLIKWWIAIIGIFGGVLAIYIGIDRLNHPRSYNSQL
ncbi:hypothetical protein FJZ18_02780 [Candidatus Pacearchaeota archaeon]|nr:hypothetical protein [Candidatus Pacearchaeota archaeon]